jgi:hypothetical protein
LRRLGELVFELFGSEYDFLKEVMPFLRLVLGFYFYLLWQDDILSLSWSGLGNRQKGNVTGTHRRKE